MKKTLKRTIIAFLFTCLVYIPANTMAQTDPYCPPECPGPFCDVPQCAPIDGGVLFLIIAGVGFAAKLAYDERKKKLSIA